MLNTEATHDRNASFEIVATDRDKKIAIAKALRAASKKVVF